MIARLTFIFCLFVLNSCGQGSQEDKNMNVSLMEVIPDQSPPPPPPMEVAKIADPSEKSSPKKSDTISKKIIKNGEMEIAVANLLEAKKRFPKLLKTTKLTSKVKLFAIQKRLKMSI